MMKHVKLFGVRRTLRPAPKRILFLLLLLLLFVTILCSVAIGARRVSVQDVYAAVFLPDQASYAIHVVRKRIPRTFFSLLCGASLGTAGSLMQSVTRNPIADPSILGVNTGAAVFVVCGISFFQMRSPASYMAVALAGAFFAAVLVFFIGASGKGNEVPIRLVLAGAAVSAAASCVVSAVLLPRSYVLNQYRFWQVGSVGGGTWNDVLILLPFAVAGIGTALLLAEGLNVLALGEEAAVSMGVRTGPVRAGGIFAGVLLCGSVTALAGPIAFVGLLAPHLVRLIAGINLKIAIPLSAFAGAIILTLADVAGRLLSYPGELEVGVVTALIGAPMLIYTAVRAKL